MASSEDFSVKVGVDLKRAEQKLQAFKNKIKNISSMTDRLNSASKGDIQSLQTEMKKEASMRRQTAEKRKQAGFDKAASASSVTALMGQGLSANRALGNLKADTQFANSEGMAEQLDNLQRKVDRFNRAVANPKTRKRAEALARIYKTRIKESILDARAAQRKFNQELRKGTFAASSLKRSIGNMGRMYLSIYSVFAAGNFIRKAVADFEMINATLLASSTSAEDAANKFEFVKDTAMELGTPLVETGKGYSQIAAASKQAGLSVKDSEEIFLAATEASTAFGLSADDTAGVMRAFTQIVGKKQVMMEELKLQLGDRLPTVMGIFADSAGVTTDQLFKMIEAGEVGVDEFLNFATALRSNVRETGALAAALNTLERKEQRVINQAKIFADTVGKEDLRAGYVSVLELLTQTLQSEGFTRFAKDIMNVFGSLVGIIAEVLKSVVGVIDFAISGFHMLQDAIVDFLGLANSDNDFFKDMVNSGNTLVSIIRQIKIGWMFVSYIVSVLIDKFEQFLSYDLFPFLGGLNDLRNNVTDAITNKAKETVSQGVQNIGNKVEIIIDGAGENAKEIADNVGGYLSELFSVNTIPRT